MKKLSVQKRNHLIIVALATAGVMVGLWFFLISAQKDKIASIARKYAATKQEIEKVKGKKGQELEVNLALNACSNRLALIEGTLPSGDLYSWFVNTLKAYNTNTLHVDMPQISKPALTDMTMLPGFPYRQAVVTVAGTAYYYDLGRFIAGFENKYPYMRIQNLALDPGPTANPEDREKLVFKMDIVTLIKTNAP
jgi:Tfp pilus assembly protein PilO